MTICRTPQPLVAVSIVMLAVAVIAIALGQLGIAAVMMAVAVTDVAAMPLLRLRLLLLHQVRARL